jgi:hypothetical protein
MRRDAPGHRDLTAFDVIFSRGVARFAGREFILEWINALGAQGGKLGLTLFDQ